MPIKPIAATFDLSRCLITINGVPVTGFTDADEGAVECTQENDDWDLVTGADGTGQWNKMPSSPGSIKIKLLYVSPSNAALQLQTKLDRSTGKAAAPIKVVDMATGSSAFIAQARLKKPPALSIGRKGAAKEWEFFGPAIEIIHGAGIPTPVG